MQRRAGVDNTPKIVVCIDSQSFQRRFHAQQAFIALNDSADIPALRDGLISQCQICKNAFGTTVIHVRVPIAKQSMTLVTPDLHSLDSVLDAGKVCTLANVGVEAD